MMGIGGGLMLGGMLGWVVRRRLMNGWLAVREDDILCLLESEREARRLR